MNAKARLEMDASAQRSTMENQLQQIGMLENALTNTQVNANRCDEEVTTFLSTFSFGRVSDRSGHRDKFL